jgi:hypothetical protein
MSDKARDRIIQIRYVKMLPSDGLVEVKASNTFSGEPPYEWHMMPALYDDHLKRIFYRLDLLSNCANMKLDAPVIKFHLGYLDKVLDAMWAEVDKAENEGKMNPDWRSEILDMWLSIEGKIGRHNPEAVAEYIKKNGLDQLTSDPTEIGMS